MKPTNRKIEPARRPAGVKYSNLPKPPKPAPKPATPAAEKTDE